MFRKNPCCFVLSNYDTIIDHHNALTMMILLQYYRNACLELQYYEVLKYITIIIL